jgi:tol-pal system protein YbgF
MRAVAVLVGSLLAGCASAGDDQARMAEMNRTIQALRVQNAAYSKQVEELENRVFILGDQVEQKTAPAKPAAPPAPELPKVTLHKKEIVPTVEQELASEDEVEYAGDAAKPSAKRPLLRLYGDDLTVIPAGEPAKAPPKAAPEPRRAPERRLAVAGEGRPKPNLAAVELYRRSLDSLRGGGDAEAMAGFREFLRLYPQHDLADNAQYWLAEGYYAQKDYPLAMKEFRRVVERYPQGNKVADALLKVGFCHLALGSTAVGRQTLEQVVRNYPRAEAAALAGARLAEIGPDTSNEPRPRPTEEQP